MEYRLAASTFDADWIEHWIRVCHGLVKYAYNTGSETVKFCRGWFEESVEECTLADVLEELGLKEEAEYFTTRIAGNLGDVDEEEEELECPDQTRFW